MLVSVEDVKCGGDVIDLIDLRSPFPALSGPICFIGQESGPSATQHLLSAPAQSWQR